MFRWYMFLYLFVLIEIITCIASKWLLSATKVIDFVVKWQKSSSILLRTHSFIFLHKPVLHWSYILGICKYFIQLCWVGSFVALDHNIITSAKSEHITNWNKNVSCLETKLMSADTIWQVWILYFSKSKFLIPYYTVSKLLIRCYMVSKFLIS